MKLTGLNLKFLVQICECVLVLHLTNNSFVDSQPSSGVQRYCGGDFANMVSLVCSSVGYNSKRLDPEVESTEMAEPVPELEFVPYIGRHPMIPFLAKRVSYNKRSREDSHECCRRGCNYIQLTRYCSKQPTY